MTSHPRPKKPKKVRLYPVLPYQPRKDRFAFDMKSRSFTSLPIKAYRQCHWRNVAFNGIVHTSDEDVWETVGGQVSLKTFQRNKDWKQLVAKGQNATYPYSRSDGFAKPASYYGTSVAVGVNPDTTTLWGQYFGPVLVQAKDNTELKDLALTRLKRKLNGYVGQAQLAAPLAESREIHRLVKQINGFGMDTVNAILRLKRSRGKSLLKHVSQIWLGFGFGINPMLKDIESAANSILDYQTRADRSVRVSGVANWDYFSRGLASPPADIATGVYTQCIGYGSHKQGVRIVAGVDLTIRSNASYSVLDHLGLGITSMPSAIWELVPYSWAVDYFTTVSPWLDDVFYTLPGQCKYVSQTEKYQNDVVWQILLQPANPNRKTSLSCKPGGFRHYDIIRSSLATLPTRQLRIKSVDAVAIYGLTKFLNLAAVLAGHLATSDV